MSTKNYATPTAITTSTPDPASDKPARKAVVRSPESILSAKLNQASRTMKAATESLGSLRSKIADKEKALKDSTAEYDAADKELNAYRAKLRAAATSAATTSK